MRNQAAGFRALKTLDSNPKTAAQGADFFWILVSAKEFNLGREHDFNKVGIRALDKKTIEFRLVRPTVSLPSLLSFTVSLPIRLDLVEAYGDKWLAPSKLAVLGPYKLAESKSQQIVLEVNDQYFGPPPRIKKFKFTTVNEAQTALDLFESGQVEVLFDPPRTQLEKLRARSEFRIYPQVRAFGFGMNSKLAPFDNQKVRQAFALATDRNSIVEVLDIHKKTGDPSAYEALKSWIPKGIDCYNSKIGLDFNPALAKKRLKEAGFPEGKNFPKVKLMVTSSESAKLIAERLQELWLKILNIKIEIESMEFPSFLNRLMTDTPTIFTYGIGAIYNDPHLFSLVFQGDAPVNHTHWKDKTYDLLVDQAAGIADLDRRQKLYDRAEKILLEEAAVFVPLYQSSLTALVSKKLKNFTTNLQGTPMMMWADYDRSRRH